MRNAPSMVFFSALVSVLPWVVVGFAPFLGFLLLFFVPFPLFFLGLSQGLRRLFFASLLHVGFLCFIPGLTAAIFSSVFWVFPTLFLTFQALRVRTSEGVRSWYPPSNLLAYTTAFAAMTTLAILAIFALPPEPLELTMRTFFSEGLERMIQDLSYQDMVVFRELSQDLSLPEWMIFVGPGSYGVIALLGLSCFGALAQRVLQNRGLALRDRVTLEQLSVPNRIFLAPLILCVLISLFSNPSVSMVGTNLLMVFAVPYFLLGQSVAHMYARSLREWGYVFLIFLYVAQFITWFFLLGAVLLGLAETRLHVRRKLAERIRCRNRKRSLEQAD